MTIFKPRVAAGREWERWQTDVSNSANSLNIDVFEYLQVSASITLNDTHGTVEVITAGITVVLPEASAITGKNYVIDNSSTGNITVVPHGTDKIEDESSQVVPPNSCMVIYCNGTGWRIQ